MSEIDITEKIKVQRICSAGGMVLADKMAKQKNESVEIKKKENDEEKPIFREVFDKWSKYWQSVYFEKNSK